MPFYPGPGVGGDCIPVSPILLAHQAKAKGGETPLVDLAASINRDMPAHVARRIADVVRARAGKPMNQAKILMLGVCYKKNVEDTRVSASMALIGEIEATGKAAFVLHWKSLGRQALHAWKLGFKHPADQRPLSFEAPLPADFKALIERLRKMRS